MNFSKLRNLLADLFENVPRRERIEHREDKSRVKKQSQRLLRLKAYGPGAHVHKKIDSPIQRYPQIDSLQLQQKYAG